MACWFGRTDCVATLLDNGADREVTDDGGRNALLWSAWNGHSGCIVLLIQKAISINHQDNHGKTALHLASQEGHASSLKILLENGAEIDKKNNSDQTALDTATRCGKVDCVKVLLEHGASIAIINSLGETVVNVALENGSAECLKALLLAKVRLIIYEDRCKVLAVQRDLVRVSRRRLKIALLSFYYAGAETDPKVSHPAGTDISTNKHLYSELFLSHSGTRSDTLLILMYLLAEGKQVNYPLFNHAIEHLGHYLVIQLIDVLRELNNYERPLESAIHAQSDSIKSELLTLCNPDLVEENFGDLIRKGLRLRYRELFNSFVSTAPVLLPTATSSRSY